MTKWEIWKGRIQDFSTWAEHTEWFSQRRIAIATLLVAISTSLAAWYSSTREAIPGNIVSGGSPDTVIQIHTIEGGANLSVFGDTRSDSEKIEKLGEESDYSEVELEVHAEPDMAESPSGHLKETVEHPIRENSALVIFDESSLNYFGTQTADIVRRVISRDLLAAGYRLQNRTEIEKVAEESALNDFIQGRKHDLDPSFKPEAVQLFVLVSGGSRSSKTPPSKAYNLGLHTACAHASLELRVATRSSQEVCWVSGRARQCVEGNSFQPKSFPEKHDLTIEKAANYAAENLIGCLAEHDVTSQ